LIEENHRGIYARRGTELVFSDAPTAVLPTQ
jgi:hypothetical protein